MPREIRSCPRCDAAGRVYDNPDPTRPPTIVTCLECDGTGTRLTFVYVLLNDLRKNSRKRRRSDARS